MVTAGLCIRWGDYQLFTALQFQIPSRADLGRGIKRRWREAVSRVEWSLRGALLPPCMA